MNSKADTNTKRALIVHAILTNNGDAALVTALYQSLKNAGYDCRIATLHYNKIRAAYPDLPLEPDWNSSLFSIKLPPLRPLIAKWQFARRSSFVNADLVVGCPGGYMNSFYGFSHKLRVFEMARNRGKNTGIYAQSFGPFTESGEKELIEGSQHLQVLMARDERSEHTLNHLGLADKCIRSNDAAFLLEPLPNKAITKQVAVSVREWSFDSRDRQRYLDLMTSLVGLLVNRGFEITFLSTCQGIPGYVDDSRMAVTVLSELPESVQSHCRVDSSAYNLNELRDRLRGFEFVVGTRLHMCILGMLSGAPAFNISYEFKGAELFRSLGWENFSVDYNDASDHGVKALEEFLSQLESIKQSLGEVLRQEKEKASTAFASFVRRIED